MALQRVLTDEERTRRAAGWVFAVAGLIGLLLLGSYARAGGISVMLVVLMSMPAALLALGLWLALNRRLALDVDAESRTYVRVEKGRPGEARPIDELGPLVVSMRSRTVRSKDSSRTIIEYAVHPQSQPQLAFHVEKSALAARRRMETLARAWTLPCRSYGGDVRGADDLDKPLHERLRGDHDARKGQALRPEWGLTLQPLEQGQAIVSTHRSWAPLGQAALLLVPTLFVFGGMMRSGLRSVLSSPQPDVQDQVFLGLMAAVVLALLVNLAFAARQTFAPGQIRVTPEGVAYRLKKMRFAEIEEVIGSYGVELVGDRRSLKIPPSFCPPEAAPTLAKELRRLIVEIAPMAAP